MICLPWAGLWLFWVMVAWIHQNILVDLIPSNRIHAGSVTSLSCMLIRLKIPILIILYWARLWKVIMTLKSKYFFVKFCFIEISYYFIWTDQPQNIQSIYVESSHFNEPFSLNKNFRVNFNILILRATLTKGQRKLTPDCSYLPQEEHKPWADPTLLKKEKKKKKQNEGSEVEWN